MAQTKCKDSKIEIEVTNDFNQLIDKCVKKLMTFIECGCKMETIDFWKYLDLELLVQEDESTIKLFTCLDGALFPKIRGCAVYDEDNMRKAIQDFIEEVGDCKSCEILEWLDKHFISYYGAKMFMADLHKLLNNAALVDKRFVSLGFDNIQGIGKIKLYDDRISINGIDCGGELVGIDLFPSSFHLFTKQNIFLRNLFYHYKDVGIN